jgi:hypothetical protein
MLELDETTRRALSQRYGPSAETQARVLSELRGTLAGPLGPGGGDGGEGGLATGSTGAGSGSGQAVWIAKVCAATAGLTGAGLLVLKLGATVLVDGGERSSPAIPERVEVPARAREPSPDAATPKSQADAPSSIAPPTAVPIQTPTKRHSSNTGTTLAAELALLDAAERIRSTDPEGALVHIDQHLQEFPTGALAPEREAMRVEVLCALGRAPKSASCGGTASNKTGD